MDRYIIAHDLGTSGDKATLFSLEGKLVKSITVPYPTHYFNANWSEQDPLDWWRAFKDATNALMEGAEKNSVCALVCSGQMMGCLCLDRQGNPLHKALIFSDMRSSKETQEIMERMSAYEFHDIVGQRPSPAYTLEKLMWMKKNKPDVYKNTYKILLTKDYIVHRLTGKFVTDFSDASGTSAFDLDHWCWAQKVIEEVCGLNMEIFPDIQHATSVIGELTASMADELGLHAGTPVVLGGGDGRCSSIGTGNVTHGQGHVCIGTSAWMQMTLKETIKDEQHRLTNWAHIVPGLVVSSGPMQSAGASFSWIVKQLCGLEFYQAEKENLNVYDLINKLIESSSVGANGLIFLPYMYGERSPRWNPEAKGCFIGLKMEHTRPDMLRSVIEGVAYNLRLIQNIMSAGIRIDSLNLIGGMAEGTVQQKIFADVFGIKLNKLRGAENATSIGAAVTAGVGIGEFKSFESVGRFTDIETEVLPDFENTEKYKKVVEIFDRAYYGLYDVFSDLAKL